MMEVHLPLAQFLLQVVEVEELKIQMATPVDLVAVAAAEVALVTVVLRQIIQDQLNKVSQARTVAVLLNGLVEVVVVPEEPVADQLEQLVDLV